MEHDSRGSLVFEEGDHTGKFFLSTEPPADAEAQALAQGLFLNGRQLEAPRFHKVDWERGHVFMEEDDPDRTRQAWLSPSFASSKDPVQQRRKTSVEDLYISSHPGSNSFARVVYGLIDEDDCAALITAVNEKGYTPALLNIGAGKQQLQPYVRNGHRVIVDSPELSGWMFQVLKPYLPETIRGGQLVELNERLRFLCYTPGQEFTLHRDGNFRRPDGHIRAGDSSRVTIQIYLHDVPVENGGATTFDLGSNDPLLPCQPKAGSALIFTQDLWHEGSLLRSGLKYTLRTEAMYSGQ